jgi:hypothetical protein
MTENGLTEEEQEQLENLRQRKLVANYRNRVEERLDGVSADVIEYTETGIDGYDGVGPEPRYNWLEQFKRLYGTSLPNNSVLVSSSGTVHFIEFWKERWDGEEYPLPYCRSAQMKGEVVAVENVELSVESYCKTCLKNKRRMQAANIAIRDTP